MAKAKKSKSYDGWGFSWRGFLVGASFALNVGFVTVFGAMAFTSSFDQLWVQEGFERYCLTDNDKLYEDSSKEAKALRDFSCAKGEAKTHFEGAYKEYLKTVK